jgi:hypothetical protein
MSFPSTWGPYSFSISSDETKRTITLTQITTSCPNAPSGTTPYNVSIAREGDSGSDRGTVMLDDDGTIQAFCNPNRHKSWGYTLTGMGGQFDPAGGSTDGTWKGESDGSSDGGPTGTEGTWEAGGPGQPFPKKHEHKHGHHA